MAPASPRDRNVSLHRPRKMFDLADAVMTAETAGSGDVSDVKIAGFALADAAFDLSDGRTVQATGTFSLDGLSLPLPKGTAVSIDASSGLVASLASFSETPAD